MIRRLIAVLLMVIASLSVLSPPASAQRLIGCDSLLNWPCPGPVPAAR